MSYNNQTGVITDHIYSADVALMSNNATALKDALINTNNLLINEVKNLSACGKYINQNVTQILQNNNKQLEKYKFNITEQRNFVSEIFMGKTQYTLELHGLSNDASHINNLKMKKAGLQFNPTNDTE